MPTAYLIDASPYIFRAYFALPSTMVDRDGRPAGAVYGFASFLLKFLEEERPTHVGVAFDGSLTTSFRNEIYPDYKAQREPPDAALEAQLDDCLRIADAIGVATAIDARFEADDLIASWAAGLAPGSGEIVVVTSDKDLAQLVDRRTTLLDYAKEARYDVAAVEAKFGVKPEQIPDYLGLAGDAVDNIPGVRGVGAKTASALLAEFADLDELYADLDRVGALPIRGARSLVPKLADGREIALLSRELATVSVAAPVAGGWLALRLAGAPRGARRATAEQLLERLGFDGLKSRVLAPSRG